MGYNLEKAYIMQFTPSLFPVRALFLLSQAF